MSGPRTDRVHRLVDGLRSRHLTAQLEAIKSEKAKPAGNGKVIRIRAWTLAGAVGTLAVALLAALGVLGPVLEAIKALF